MNGESPYYKSIEIKNDTIVVSFERANMWITVKNCFESKNFQVAGERQSILSGESMDRTQQNASKK